MACAGPLLDEKSYNIGGQIGFAPNPNLALCGELEYNHIPHQGEQINGGFYEEPGRDLFFALAVVKLSGFTSRMVSGYGLAGLGNSWIGTSGGGYSQGGSGSGLAVMLGAGLGLRLAPRTRIFVEVMNLVTSAIEDGFGGVPLRIGIATER